MARAHSSDRNLGDPAVCGKSEEAIVALKRLIPVEPRASTCAMLSEKRRELIDENIYDRKRS